MGSDLFLFLGIGFQNNRLVSQVLKDGSKSEEYLMGCRSTLSRRESPVDWPLVTGAPQWNGCRPGWTFAPRGRPTRNIREGVAFLRYTVAVRESAEEPIFGILLAIVLCAFHQH